MPCPSDYLFAWDEQQILVVNEHEYRMFPLSHKLEKPPAIGKSPFPLSMVKIIPGEFYVTEQNSLGYFHQIECPGELADKLCSTLSVQISDEAFRHATDVLNWRREGTAERQSIGAR